MTASQELETDSEARLARHWSFSGLTARSPRTGSATVERRNERLGVPSRVPSRALDDARASFDGDTSLLSVRKSQIRTAYKSASGSGTSALLRCYTGILL